MWSKARPAARHRASGVSEICERVLRGFASSLAVVAKSNDRGGVVLKVIRARG